MSLRPRHCRLCGGSISGAGLHRCEEHRGQKRSRQRRVRVFLRPEQVRALESDELALDEGTDSTGLPWASDRCGSSRCMGRRITVGFAVSDETWVAVTGAIESPSLCLSCFDEMAQRRGVRYEILALSPVTWADPAVSG